MKLRGVATLSLWAADHEAAVAWYSRVLGLEPYFARPGYVEYRIGDHETEIGIIDSKYAPHLVHPQGPSGVVVYWHVDDVTAAFDRLLTLGATQLEAPQDRGHGFVTATVVDPFGNILGVMYNPHYQGVAGSR
jgi:predicted enzyme related to lactoylglutathione lyase